MSILSSYCEPSHIYWPGITRTAGLIGLFLALILSPITRRHEHSAFESIFIMKMTTKNKPTWNFMEVIQNNLHLL